MRKTHLPNTQVPGTSSDALGPAELLTYRSPSQAHGPYSTLECQAWAQSRHWTETQTKGCTSYQEGTKVLVRTNHVQWDSSEHCRTRLHLCHVPSTGHTVLTQSGITWG